MCCIIKATPVSFTDDDKIKFSEPFSESGDWLDDSSVHIIQSNI